MATPGRLTVRVAWFVFGLGALALAGLGVVLPLLPTTPFVLLAAFAFLRSSRRMHRWLLGHSVFGPLITDWRHHGAISRPAKVASVLSMAGVFALSLLLQAPPVVIFVQAPILAVCAGFVLSRPSPPRPSMRR